jgi:hypothetical protein
MIKDNKIMIFAQGSRVSVAFIKEGHIIESKMYHIEENVLAEDAKQLRDEYNFNNARLQVKCDPKLEECILKQIKRARINVTCIYDHKQVRYTE